MTVKQWNKTRCKHTSIGTSCDYCDEVIFKLSSFNALNLCQILNSIAKGNLDLANYDQRFCQNILNEIVKNSFRQNPNFREYELLRSDFK